MTVLIVKPDDGREMGPYTLHSDAFSTFPVSHRGPGTNHQWIRATAAEVVAEFKEHGEVEVHTDLTPLQANELIGKVLRERESNEANIIEED